MKNLIGAVATVVLLLGLVGCNLLGAGDSVLPLMKAEGWRDDLGPGPPPFAIVEIAFDRETAERAWVENTPEDLPRRTGAPEEPGIYGDLAQVDFDTQAAVVWSSGESSTCPGWLAGIDVTDQGTVEIQTEDTAGFFGSCTDDFGFYRMVVVVERGRLPKPDELPTEDVVGISSGRVTTYPVDR
ncbi:MAG: hypothetical protein WD208_09475 [Dehalococcoidia bacterium]